MEEGFRAEDGRWRRFLVRRMADGGGFSCGGSRAERSAREWNVAAYHMQARIPSSADALVVRLVDELPTSELSLLKFLAACGVCTSMSLVRAAQSAWGRFSMNMKMDGVNHQPIPGHRTHQSSTLSRSGC